jgi:hypothetical protein
VEGKSTLLNHDIKREVIAINDHHIVWPLLSIPISFGNPCTTGNVFVDLIFTKEVGVGSLMMLNLQCNLLSCP